MAHQEGNFTTPDGLQLYTQSWLPENTLKAHLVMIHGIGEHGGRYANFAAWFKPLGYAVHTFDHRGHGKSPGQRGHINAWSEYRGDVGGFVAGAHDTRPDIPLFLVGHSLGGLIVLDYVLHGVSGLRGVVVSGPPLAWSAATPQWRVVASRVLARLAPRMAMPTGLDVNGLSHDPGVLEAYRTDPLVHGLATPAFAAAMDRTMRETMARADAWPSDLPLLIVHGGADPICPPEASARFFANVAARDKLRHVYPDFLHESFNEIGREQVLTDVQTWLDAHL
ncbi:MAG TPA: lysophospholipase [Anaerolineae bacterium]|nr:lysophospholipase [Anaerolineae bacterium]